jgi:hypothetical protein
MASIVFESPAEFNNLAKESCTVRLPKVFLYGYLCSFLQVFCMVFLTTCYEEITWLIVAFSAMVYIAFLFLDTTQTRDENYFQAMGTFTFLANLWFFMYYIGDFYEACLGNGGC